MFSLRVTVQIGLLFITAQCESFLLQSRNGVPFHSHFLCQHHLHLHFRCGLLHLSIFTLQTAKKLSVTLLSNELSVPSESLLTRACSILTRHCSLPHLFKLL